MQHGLEDGADLVMFNGAIYTMDSQQPWAQALAIRDGKLIAVGTNKQAVAAASATAQLFDLQGRMVMPGIIDVHNHFLWAGRSELYETHFSSQLDLDQVLERVAEAAAKLPIDGWVVGGTWGSGLLGRLDLAARQALDQAAGGRPVMLRDDTHHSRWVNSQALRLAGIDASTPDPVNGTIVRDAASGEPTGMLLEAASVLVEAVVAQALAASPQLDFQAGVHALKRLNAYGITGAQESMTTRPVMEAIHAIDQAGQLTAWVVGSLPVVDTAIAFGDWGESLFAVREQFRSRHFFPDAGKICLDGVPTARTAAMIDPYLPDAVHGCCFRGGTMLTVPQLAKALADSEAVGLSVKIHCAGDGAVRAALDAIEVLRQFNGPGKLHHIAHASFIDPQDIPRFATLNVVADLSPMLWFPGVIVEAIRAAVPQERVDRFWPNRDLHAAGALLACGSDWPVVQHPDPWLGIQGMVTRRDPQGQFPGALWPEQALDLATVLRTYTLNPAIAMGLEATTGSLELGKSADLIVLDRHLFQIPPDALAKTRVLSTWFEGRLVYEAAP